MKIHNIQKTFNEETNEPFLTCEIEITDAQLNQLQSAISVYGEETIQAIVGKELISQLLSA